MTRRPIVWCETHNPKLTPLSPTTAHPLTATCVHPHDVGPEVREAYLDRLVEADARTLVR